MRESQFTIASLLLLQVILSVILTLWKALGCVPVAYGLLCGAFAALVVAATVWCASDRPSKRRLFRRRQNLDRYLVWVIVAGFLLFLLTLLALRM